MRGFRWAVDDMERTMDVNADFLDELDGEGTGEAPREMGDNATEGVETSAEAPPKGSRHDGVVAYPDLSSSLSRLEREEYGLGVLQHLGGTVAPRSKSSPGLPPQHRGDGVLDGDLYPELRRTISRV